MRGFYLVVSLLKAIRCLSLTLFNVLKIILLNIISFFKTLEPSVWIALFSFIVALATIWLTTLSPVRISARVGNTVAIYFSSLIKSNRERDLVSIALSLDLLNKGARSGLIENIALKVKFGNSDNVVLYKILREISEIQIYTKKDNSDVDVEKMERNVKDPFTSLTLLGKSRIQKNYVFIPANEEEFIINQDVPHVIKVELYIQKDNQWKRYDEISFNNSAVNIDNKTGWALIESQESIEEINQLSE